MKYYGAAMLYTITLCGNETLAEDLVAEAFVKAYISLPGDISSFQFWLFKVCKNLWIDYIRKNKHNIGSDALDSMSIKTTPEAVYLSKEKSKDLWRAIGTLSPQERELITLFYFSDLNMQEISYILGKSYTAVRKKLSRLRIKLKQRMEEQGYDI